MKKDKLPPIVTILILTLIVIVFWIFFSVYRVFSTEADPVVPESVLAPIEGRLDTQTTEDIKSRIYQEGSTITIVTTPEPDQPESNSTETTLEGEQTATPSVDQITGTGSENLDQTDTQTEDNIDNNQ